MGDAERPVFVLTRPPWASDKDVGDCTQCQSAFTTFNRRHHCRQCGLIFCNKCCGHKVFLPQLGYDKRERVCDGCHEIAEIVANVVSDVASFQCQGARALAEYGNKENGLSKLVAMGGLDALLHLCSTAPEEVLVDATAAVEALARFDVIQNTMITKGVLPILFGLCASTTIRNVAIVTNAVRTLFHFAKTDDACGMIATEKGIHVLLDVAHKERPGAPQEQVAALQGLAARTLSYISTHDKNQLKIIEDRKGALEYLVGLLNSRNDDVRKYAAKSLAYLSLRNDKSKAQILRGNSMRSILQVMKTDSVRETLSHIACTIANLATNGESQSMLIGTDGLLLAFCRMAESATDRSDIVRHVVRGLANFALYEANKDKLVTVALPLLIKLGHASVPETLRHIIRALDNRRATASDGITLMLRDAGTAQVLQTFIATQTGPESADMVKRATIALEQLAQPSGGIGGSTMNGTPGSGSKRSPINDKTKRASSNSPTHSVAFAPGAAAQVAGLQAPLNDSIMVFKTEQAPAPVPAPIPAPLPAPVLAPAPAPEPVPEPAPAVSIPEPAPVAHEPVPATVYEPAPVAEPVTEPVPVPVPEPVAPPQPVSDPEPVAAEQQPEPLPEPVPMPEPASAVQEQHDDFAADQDAADQDAAERDAADQDAEPVQ